MVTDIGGIQKKLRDKNLRVTKPRKNKLLKGIGNISILKDKDTQQPYFAELKAELAASGLDNMPHYEVTYDRLDMYRMLFKFAHIEDLFAQPPAQTKK